MKVIFLDVDGVLNSVGWMEENKKYGLSRPVDPSKVRLLKQIIDSTGAKVVLSSTWRNVDGSNGEPEHEVYGCLVRELGKCGIRIYSRTPLINNDRPKEIKAWLDSHPSVGEFVSLDDDFGEEDYQRHGISGCLIQTRFWDGNFQTDMKLTQNIQKREGGTTLFYYLLLIHFSILSLINFSNSTSTLFVVFAYAKTTLLGMLPNPPINYEKN